MTLVSVILFLLMFNIDYFNAAACITNRYSGIVQVECSEINISNEVIADDVTHLIIKCNKSHSASTASSLSRFIKLNFLSISQCSKTLFPDDMFHNLTELRVVHFDQLGIKSLSSNMFQNLKNLEELHLTDLRNLTSISHLAMGVETHLKEISLVKLRIPAENVWTFLSLSHKTLEKLSWIQSYRKMDFPATFFLYFQLKHLRLLKNQIDNITFLCSTQADSVDLSYNYLGYNRNFFMNIRISNSTKELKLSYNFIGGLFPPSSSGSRTNIQRLSINNNKIIGFSEEFPVIFPDLESLDASNNMITNVVDPIKYSFRSMSINLLGNSIFCGCNLNDWLGQLNGTSWQMDCTVLLKKKNRNIQVTRSRLGATAGSKFICLEPTVSFWIYAKGGLVKINDNEDPVENTVIELYQCEYLQIKCIVKGDPLPDLHILNPNEPFLTPTLLQYNDPVTVSTPLLSISHSGLSSAQKNNYLKCKGINNLGEMHRKISFRKMPGFRPVKDFREGITVTYLCDRGATPALIGSIVPIIICHALCVYMYFNTGK